MKHQKKRASRGRPIALIVIGILLLVGSGLILILDPFGDDPPGSSPTTGSGVPFPEVERIEPDVAFEALNDPNVVIVDTRSAEEWARAFIPGSINIPVDEIEARMGELDKDDWIITVCT